MFRLASANRRPGGQVSRPWISKRLIATVILAITASCASAQTPKNVLVLHGGFPKLPYNIAADQEIEDVFATDRDFHIQVFNEYRDEKRLDTDDRQFMRFLSQKYEGQHFDLVFAVSPIALHLLLKEGQDVWPNTPVVFATIVRAMIPKQLPPQFAGVSSLLDLAGTLDLALHLEPDVDRVFYVAGTSEWEQFERRSSEAELRRFAGKVKIEYLDRLEFPELLSKVSQLPTHSIVLYQEFNKDPSGRVYSPPQVCSQLSVSSNVPVYAISYLGQGAVGGSVVNFSAGDRQAALMALRIMHGEKIGSQVADAPANLVKVDWRQLHRWQLPESRLPAGTIVEFREPTLWEQYKWYIMTGVVVLALQFLQVIKLKIEVNRRRRSELELRSLSGRLISAGEAERKHVARELHDDIGQRVAMLLVEITSQTEETTKQGWVQQVMQELDEIASDVHNLSHRLHSSRLELLGLEVALRRMCQQLARQHHRDIQFTALNVPSPLADGVALCFYRVAQEALNNSIKYSGSERIELKISADDGILRMAIKDFGCGFSPSRATTGLGLATMRERLRMAEGQLLISSRPGNGTEVTAEARLGRRSRDLAA